MEINVSYRRLNPDTLSGNKIQVIYTYSSFDCSEIDDIERQLKETIKSGIHLSTKGRKE